MTRLARTPSQKPALNLSIVLRDLPVANRLAAAKDAGHTEVEFWWPFDTASPTPAEVDGFVADIQASGLQLVGLNLFAGDMPAGDRGILSWPGRENELLASVQIAADIAARLGVQRFNALYGNRLDGFDPDTQDEVAEANLRRIAPMLDAVGGVVMIEPVSGSPAYPVKTASDAADIIARASANGGPQNVGLLLDLYHLAVNGDDVPAAIAAYGRDAAHVQLADAPGRGAPGTGDLPLADWMIQLRAAGYQGHTALEYAHPAGMPLAPATDWKDLA